MDKDQRIKELEAEVERLKKGPALYAIDKHFEQSGLQTRFDNIVMAGKDVVSQYPLIHGTPVPAWIRNLEEALRTIEGGNNPQEDS